MAWRFSSWLKCVCISIGLLNNFISGHAHGFSRGILNIYGLYSNGWPPMKAITFPERFLSTNKLLYFNIELNIFNSTSPFTIPTNTRKFAASTACILNVAHFVDSSPTSACNFRFFLEILCNRCWSKYFHGLRQLWPSCTFPPCALLPPYCWWCRCSCPSFHYVSSPNCNL